VHKLRHKHVYHKIEVGIQWSKTHLNQKQLVSSCGEGGIKMIATHFLIQILQTITARAHANTLNENTNRYTK
jgi:hypothetical protein